MSDWLTIIEVALEEWRETQFAEGVPEMPNERMARVIRELAKMVRMFHNLSSVPQIDLQKVVDLSDDAKELLGRK